MSDSGHGDLRDYESGTLVRELIRRGVPSSRIDAEVQQARGRAENAEAKVAELEAANSYERQQTRNAERRAEAAEAKVAELEAVLTRIDEALEDAVLLARCKEVDPTLAADVSAAMGGTCTI